MAERRFSVRLDAEMNIGQVKTAVQQMQSELSKLSLPSDMGSKISGTFSKLTSEIEKFQAMSAKGIGSTQDFNQLATSGNKIIQIYEQLTNQVKSLGNLSDSQLSKLFPASVLNNIQKATNAVQQYENATKGTQSQMTDLAKEIEKAKNKTSQLVKQKESLEKKTAVSDTTFAQLGKDAEEAKRKFEEAQAKLTELQNQAKQKVDAAGSSSLARKSSTYRNLVDNDIPAQEAEVAKLEQAWNRVENKKNKALSQSTKDQSIAQLVSDIKKAEGNVTELQNKLNTLKVNDSQSFQNLVAQLNQISGINLDPATTNMHEIQQAIANLSSSEVENLKNSFSNFGAIVESGREPVQTLGTNLDETRGKVKQLDDAVSNVESLKSRINYFFGLTNSLYLLKRAITSALDTVKELDAVMTETAVVTDFSIGDMWDKLPEYSAEATKLGASIKDLYSATTLYYQQGLNTEAAMGVGIETMKMARIAGMEAADATEAMTAALRGFNMEVNEANATRVNDVYSELAAITAADTEQIATAMSKTASIASSANMEFETTSALLAQIIETTQEAPETAGTAMKTIIARFTEVKELFDEGMLSGEDTEGEEININKIDAALKTVGISLKDFLNGTKGIDDIFLELASKWDTLDLATQRYIATTAAGSRQQSRFIAMMSNYDRTMELVTAANNSAGASQEQFDKTLESMEAKLQKLSNAWDEFAMGLANNEILKGGVDLLTGLLETINNLTTAMSGGSGLIKSVTSLVTIIGALKVGKSLLGGGLSWAGQKMGLGGTTETITKTTDDQGRTVETIVRKPAQQGKNAGQQAGQGFVTGFNQAIAKSRQGQTGVKNFMKNVFTTDEKIAWGQKNPELVQGIKTDYLAEAWDQNQEGFTSGEMDFSKITTAYDEVIQKGGDTQVAAAAANAELQKMGGVMIQTGTNSQVASQGIQAAALNMQAMGQAAMGVGATLGLLSNLFDSLGMEDAAKATSTLAAVFMGLGTVMTTLSTIAPMLGMSFTTAGIQISTAGFTAQIAWWWVFAIIAAVAALTIGVIALAKAAKEQSLAGQMEKAQQATEAATQAAESAKTAYDDLLNAQSEYSSLQETLENLTKGTDKWKQALIEANAQVLQLLSTYPQLAEFISRGENGQLVISEAGFEKLINDQQNALQRAQAAMVSSQMGETRVQAKMDEREFKQNFQVNFTYDEDLDSWVDSYGKIYSSIPENYQIQQAQGSDSGFYYDQNLIDDLQFVLKSGDLSNEALAPLVDEYKLVGESTEDTIARLHELCLALNEYDAALLANQTQMQAQAEALLVAGADQAILDSEYNNSVVSGFAKRMTEDDYANIEQNFSKQMYTNKTNEDAGRKKYMEEELGLTSTGDELKDLQLIYKELAGLKSIEDIPEDIAQNSQALADQIGKMQAAEQQIDKMEGFQQKLNKVNKEDSIAAKSIASLMSGDASNLTLNELEQVGKLSDYAGVLGYADTETMAKDLGYTQKQLSELELEDQRAYAATQIVREEGQTDEEYQDKLDEWINNQGSFIINASVQMDIDSEQYKQQMQEAHEKASAILASKKINQGAYKNLAIETVQNLSEQVLLMSDTDAQAYVENFNGILEKSKLGESEKKQLESYLSNVDWSSMTEAVNAIDYMQSMGIDSSAIEKYWNVATDGAKTYISSLQEALNLSERMQKKVQDVVDIEERLNEGKGTYEDMMELSKAGVDISKFELTSEGWKATSEEIKDATEKLQEYNIEQARMVAMQQKETYKDFSQRWAVASKDTSGNSVLKEMTQGSLEDGLIAGDISNLSEAWQTKLANEIGYVREQEDTPEEFEAKLQEAYNNFIDQINNGENYNIITEKTAQMTEIGQYQSQIEQGETANLIANVNPDQQEALKKAIEETTKATSGAEAAMSIFIKDMSNEEKQAAKNNTTLQLLAIRHAKATTAVQNLEDKLNDNIDTLKKGPKAGDKYLKAIDEISIAAKDVFGDKATTDFVENNKKLFIQMQKGGVKGQEAFRKIRDKILEAKVEAGELSKDDLGAIKTVFNDLDDQNIEVGADFDATEAINSLLALGYTAEEVQKMMQDAGYAVEFETITHYIGQVTGTDYGPKVFQTIEGETVRAQQVVVGTATGTKVEDGSGFTPSNTGSGSSKSNWENPYDKFYNTLREINEELRVREQLERRYQNLIKTRSSSANDLYEVSRKEIEQLEKEAELQEYLKKGRQEQIDELVAKKEKKYGKYVQVSEGENGEREIRINWEEINKIKGTKKGEALQEYISQLEEWEDSIEETNDTLDDIEDTIYEINERGKDEFLDVENRTKDALVSVYQKQIDALSDINESINDTNSRLLGAMQESIEQQRQARENEKTEEELSNKQRRLAYLRQDTSGANALEIMQLEKELDEGMESYTDQLIDQKISELQKQNDEAAEQRERQIEIAQNQLDHYVETGAIWSEVESLMELYMDKENGPTGQLLELLKEGEEFAGLSELGKEEWMNDLGSTVAQALAYVMGINQLENLDGMAGKTIEVKDKNGNSYTGTVDDKGNFTGQDADGNNVIFKDVYQDYNGNYITTENAEEGQENYIQITEDEAWAKDPTYYYTTSKGKKIAVSEISSELKKGSTGNGVRALQWALKQLGYRDTGLFNNFGNDTEADLKAFQKAEGIDETGKLDDKTRTKFRLKGYKTGGLADFTGPAWLDGTKANPEYVLNADQTKSFFELVDVLGSLRGGVQSSQITGDSIYDVDINVESIGSDYDVEQLANTVKRMINDDAHYRNNNAINLSR